MMFEPEPIESRLTLCDIVPGYAYYSETGYGVAEAIVNLFEWMLGWRNWFASALGWKKRYHGLTIGKMLPLM